MTIIESLLTQLTSEVRWEACSYLSQLCSKQAIYQTFHRCMCGRYWVRSALRLQRKCISSISTKLESRPFNAPYKERKKRRGEATKIIANWYCTLQYWVSLVWSLNCDQFIILKCIIEGPMQCQSGLTQIKYWNCMSSKRYANSYPMNTSMQMLNS